MPDAELPLTPPCAILKSVEHPCPQCHSVVSDSSAFCTNCGAPQIRFSARELSPVPILVAAGAPSSIPISKTTALIDHSKDGIDRRAGLRAAFNAGVVIGILCSVPVDGSSLFALPIGGFLSVLLYRRYHPQELQANDGFKLGAWAGLAGFAVFIFIQASLVLVLHAQNVVHEQLVQLLQESQSRYTDPAMREKAKQLMTPEGIAFFMVLGSAIACFLFAVLSGAGAALSARLLRRKLPPQ